MIKFRDDRRDEQFIPILFSSQPCESTFRKFRSMTSTFWTKINLHLLVMFHMVGKIELQNCITHYKILDVKFPRTQEKIPKMGSYKLPCNEEVFHQMNVARNDAIKLAQTFEIHFADEDDLICQLPVCEPRREEFDESDIDENEEQFDENDKQFGESDDNFTQADDNDSICESIKQINL